ncbi:hypothetical protein ACFWXO_31960 [Kitasatospora sp. NPDC059088]|uniref:hypothetical protein n=1 Tax=Kitasatospora sp. NPDC059088 TaxID=3346722 RepID=UPI0036BDB80E
MQNAMFTAPVPEFAASGPCECGVTVLCWGLGADSTAILVRVLEDPVRYGLRADLSDLIVVTAVVGEEWPDTLALAEEHVLPLLRARQVRYVQVARGGPSLARDGIVVLSDTRSPERIVARGPWTLGDELRVTGTLPMYQAGRRLCSQNFKGEVLDLWFGQNINGRFCHWIGFDALERSRAERDRTFASPHRHPRYPLIEWGWDRPHLLDYLHGRFGVTWPKSYCTMCPFPVSAGSIKAHMARAALFPRSIAKALVLEYMAEALNPLCTLYSGSSLRRELTASGNAEVLAIAEAAMAAMPWTVYQVRRVIEEGRSKSCKEQHGPRCEACRAGKPAGPRCKACLKLPEQRCDSPGPRCVRKGTTWRSVLSLAPMPRGEALAVLGYAARLAETGVWGGPGGIARVVTRSREEGVFPIVEESYVAAPTLIADKERPGWAVTWERGTGLYPSAGVFGQVREHPVAVAAAVRESWRQCAVLLAGAPWMLGALGGGGAEERVAA